MGEYVVREVNERAVELDLLKDKRQLNTEELQNLEEKRQSEFLEHKAEEDEMRNAVLIDRQRREQLQRMADAVCFLQVEGREYMKRILERNAAKKKKGKKGKKK